MVSTIGIFDTLDLHHNVRPLATEIDAPTARRRATATTRATTEDPSNDTAVVKQVISRNYVVIVRDSAKEGSPTNVNIVSSIPRFISAVLYIG